MNKHTPGPWGRKPNDPHIYSPNGEKLAKVLLPYAAIQRGGRPELFQTIRANENGALMAASPALRAVCLLALAPGATFEEVQAAARAALGLPENPFLED